MGDHFVLLVDRLLTESTLGAAIESRNSLEQSQSTSSTAADTVRDSSCYNETDSILTPRKIVECRICQEEDFDSNMETPCSCCGSLKYAHRRCVQRWCNEKGDTVCEICHQQFRPGYTAPPPIFRIGGIPVNFRGNWRITRRDLHNPRIIAVVSTDRNFLDPEDNDDDDDDDAVSTTRSMICCRSVAVIFMVLLVLRHTLPILVKQGVRFSFPLIMLLLLRIAGIILPVCIILKAVTGVLRRRQQQQQANASILPSDEEAVQSPPLQNVSHSVRVG